MNTGTDYDLIACLENNGQDFTVEDISRVLAVIEGENDELDWHWILLLNDKRLVYLRGGCDYTGWDCQSWADRRFLNEDMSLHQAVKELGKYNSDDDVLGFVVELQRQLKDGKAETWREKKDQEFGLV